MLIFFLLFCLAIAFIMAIVILHEQIWQTIKLFFLQIRKLFKKKNNQIKQEKKKYKLSDLNPVKLEKIWKLNKIVDKYKKEIARYV